MLQVLAFLTTAVLETLASMPLDRIRLRSARLLVLVCLSAVLLGAAPPPILPLAERVTFSSADNTTMLVAYLFRPQGPHPTRMPAVVMMHGRAGAYSEAADGEYDERTLSRRHQEWGHFWAEQGYLAVLVDGFGPRGYPHGFPKGSYQNRPESLNEVTVRPLDAYGALVWLRRRGDVIPDGSVCRDGRMVAAPRLPPWRSRRRPAWHRRHQRPDFAARSCSIRRAG